MAIIIRPESIYDVDNDKIIDNIIENVNLSSKSVSLTSESLFSGNVILADKVSKVIGYIMSTSSENPATSNTLDYNYVSSEQDSLASITPQKQTLYEITYNSVVYYYGYDEQNDNLKKIYMQNPITGNVEIAIDNTHFYDILAFDYFKRIEDNPSIVSDDDGFPNPFATQNYDRLIQAEEGKIYKVIMAYRTTPYNREWRYIYNGKFLSMDGSNPPALYTGDKNRYYFMRRNPLVETDDDFTFSIWQTQATGRYRMCGYLHKTEERPYNLSLALESLKINAIIKGSTPDQTINGYLFEDYDENDASTIENKAGDFFIGKAKSRSAFSSVFRNGMGTPAIANLRNKKVIISICSYFDTTSNTYKYDLDVLVPIVSVTEDSDGDIDSTGEVYVSSIDLTINAASVTLEDETQPASGNMFLYDNSSNLNQTTNLSLNNAIKDEIEDEYKNGKETITLRCSINNYYDDEGNLAISYNDADKPMIFTTGDIVIPYKRTNNGNVPISEKRDGSPKSFRVTGVTLISDGALWQELQLQEVSG